MRVAILVAWAVSVASCTLRIRRDMVVSSVGVPEVLERLDIWILVACSNEGMTPVGELIVVIGADVDMLAPGKEPKFPEEELDTGVVNSSDWESGVKIRV
jgi:hypothetical protein